MSRSPQALLLGLLLGLWPMGELVLSAGPGLTQGVERSVEQRKAEADRLFEQGSTELFKLDQYQAAMQSLQQALKIYREIKDKQGEGLTLNKTTRSFTSPPTPASPAVPPKTPSSSSATAAAPPSPTSKPGTYPTSISSSSAPAKPPSATASATAKKFSASATSCKKPEPKPRSPPSGKSMTAALNPS